MTTHTPTSAPAATPLTRAEWYLVGFLLLIGIGLRVSGLQRASVEHFDEGVYASNIWSDGVKTDPGYPDRHLYAPPLFPAMVEWSIQLLGPAGLGVMWFPLLFGVLTLPLFWWVARSWFGRSAGFIALSLLSLNDVHILYSRTVLTDVPLAFCVLLTVFLWNESVRKQNWGYTLAGGGTLAMGWAIKYNGWLPIVIVLSGMIPWWWLNRHTNEVDSRKRIWLSWLLMVVVGVLLWSPVWKSLNLVGGYSVVAENHAQYITGFGNWFHSAWRQVVNHQVLNSWVGCLSVGLAWGTAAGFLITTCTETKQPHSLIVWGLVTGVTLGVAFNPAIVCGIFAGGMLLPAMLREMRRDCDPEQQRMSRESWLVAAWFFGLLLATPLYHPYPRLTLPWLLSALLGGSALLGWAVDQIFTTEQSFLSRWPKWTVSVVCAGSVVAAGIAIITGWAALSPVAWEDRTAFDRISQDILSLCATESLETERPANVKVDFVIYAYAEPGLYFHLRKYHPAVAPAGNLSFAQPGVARHPIPTFIVIGPHARQMLDDDPIWQEHQDQFTEVKRFDYSPGTFIRLNKPNWSRSTDQTTESVIIYRLVD